MTGWVTQFGGENIEPAQLNYSALALTTSLSLVWPFEAQVGLPLATAKIDVTPSGPGLTLDLPDASQGSVGADLFVTNQGASSFTVRDAVGGAIQVVAAGEAWFFYLRNNSTVAGSWGTVPMGSTGGSSAPADATYVVMSLNGTLTQERVLTGSSSVGVADGGAGGNAVLSVPNNGITNAMLDDMAQSTIKGRAAGTGTGDPVDLTATQATAILDTFTSALKGLAPASGGGTTNYLRADGSWTAPPGSGAPTNATYVVVSLDGTLTNERNLAATAPVTLTDGGANAALTISLATNGISNALFRQGAALSVVGVTGNATANVADIAAGSDGHVLRRSGTTLAFGQIASGAVPNNLITNAMLDDMAQSTIKGRAVGAGTGDPTDLTATQATAILDVFTSALKGLAPASGGGTSNFLRADGAWAAPPGGGAPTTASYVVVSLDGTLTNERTLNVLSPLSISDNGPGNDIEISLADGTYGQIQVSSGTLWFLQAGAVDIVQLNDNAKAWIPLIIAAGDETTAITTTGIKVTFRMPFAATLLEVRASLTTTSSSGTPTIDIHENGTTVLSTKITIDVGELTSTTAAVQPVISDSSLADDASITIEVDVTGTGAAGLKVMMLVERA